MVRENNLENLEREKEFSDFHGNLERTLKVMEKSENWKIIATEVLENIFNLFKEKRYTF